MELPPFAPVLDAERATSRLLLSQGERKRTGHLFKDCPALDIVAPGKAKACKPCLDRWQDVGQLARAHQQAYDAAWYAQAVATEKGAPVNLEAEKEMWDDIARTEIPKIDVYEAVVDVPKPLKKADVRPNKFGGKCVHCNGWVEAGEGALGKNAIGKWVVAHLNECPQAKPAPTAEPLRAGPYRLADGRIIRIQMSKTTGNPYAVALDEAKTYLGGGRILEGAVRLTKEEAMEWGRQSVIDAKQAGKEYGTCCVCGAHLENPESVALGIGPICGGRF